MLLRPTFTFIPPALSSPSERVPIGGEWIHEIKHDGYRMMVRRDVSGVRLLTRNGKDWTGRFPTIVDAAAGLKARSCLIDGEGREGFATVFKHDVRTYSTVSPEE
jgi:ATP-dependent DNA ligase